MAKRAIERLDEAFAKSVYLPLERAEAMRYLTAIEATGLAALEPLRDALRTALVEGAPPEAV